MTRKSKPDPKLEAMRASGCFNRHHERVTDALFADDEFFDARDVVQVKYEMLRRVSADGVPVAASANSFGFSRPSFYQAQAAFARAGINGLVPVKPGPRRAHKLSDDVVDFIEKEKAKAIDLGSTELARLVKERFGRDVHPRSVERALARREKNSTREHRCDDEDGDDGDHRALRGVAGRRTRAPPGHGPARTGAFAPGRNGGMGGRLDIVLFPGSAHGS